MACLKPPIAHPLRKLEGALPPRHAHSHKCAETEHHGDDRFCLPAGAQSRDRVGDKRITRGERASLSQRHGCHSRADLVAVTAGDPRIVGFIHPTAADRRPRASWRRSSPADEVRAAGDGGLELLPLAVAKMVPDNNGRSGTLERVVRVLRVEGVDASTRRAASL